MDAMPDLWVNTTYNDTQVQGSELGPVVYLRNGAGSPLIGYAELAERWGVSKATAGRYLYKMKESGCVSTLAYPGTHGTAIYLKKYLSTMFQISDVLYNILCRQISSDIPLPQRVQNIVSRYIAVGKDTNAIPCAEFFALEKLDFTHGKYICVDGLYHSYILIP